MSFDPRWQEDESAEDRPGGADPAEGSPERTDDWMLSKLAALIEELDDFETRCNRPEYNPADE